MAHEIIYGDTGRATLTGLSEAATALAAITREVRDGKGLAHDTRLRSTTVGQTCASSTKPPRASTA